jgi:hypothetical protein
MREYCASPGSQSSAPSSELATAHKVGKIFAALISTETVTVHHGASRKHLIANAGRMSYH